MFFDDFKDLLEKSDTVMNDEVIYLLLNATVQTTVRRGAE
jgi:hypothetical protein